MKAKKTKLNTYYVEDRCKCKGIMKYISDTKHVPCKGKDDKGKYYIYYAHQCKKCGNIEYLETIYPTVENE